MLFKLSLFIRLENQNYNKHAVLVGGVFVSIKFILDSGAGLFYIPYTLIILSIVLLCFLLMDMRHEKLSQGVADAVSEIESILLCGRIKVDYLWFYDKQINNSQNTLHTL